MEQEDKFKKRQEAESAKEEERQSMLKNADARLEQVSIHSQI